MPLFNQALQLYVFEGTEAGAFTMPAAAGAANVLGNDLDNTVTGNAFDNILDGGVGADTLAGGSGNDTYSVDNAGDSITELADGGTDRVLASLDFSLVTVANVENLTLATGEGAIDGTGNALDNVIIGNESANILDGWNRQRLAVRRRWR